MSSSICVAAIPCVAKIQYAAATRRDIEKCRVAAIPQAMSWVAATARVATSPWPTTMRRPHGRRPPMRGGNPMGGAVIP